MTRLVTDYLDESAKKFPDKIAFADKKREITFKNLQNESHKIALSIIDKGIFKRPVVIYLDKSVECIASFMGVAYSGNFYTPVDTKMPISRIEKIVDTLQPAIIITDAKHQEEAGELACTAEVVLYEEMIKQVINIEKINKIVEKIIDTDVLYVLFTSGSTGMPKGVVIPQRAVIDYTEWVTDTFKIDETHILGNQAPFYFDNSVLDIYQTLKNAALMYIIPENLFAFPIKLLEYMNEKQINIIFWVPSALCLVANLKALDKVNLKYLHKILFCGEVMPNRQLNMWRNQFKEALFANLYGPTEITDVCTSFVINRTFMDDEILPIGIPCKNTDIIVINEENKLVKVGEIGELCVRGTSLSYGYYNNPKKTAEAFVQNPLNTAYPERIYRTGDLVKYNDYGELIYVSRKDFQIKHMGHRIELGEIETAVSALNGVDVNCCLYDTNKSKIVLFYTGNLDEKVIIKELKKVLPEYMIPNKKIRLENMPINLNGKIDRVKLKELL